jgi:hypothetical protein
MRSSPTWPARFAGAVARFDAFTPDNDPHSEHDFGLLTVEEQGLPVQDRIPRLVAARLDVSPKS